MFDLATRPTPTPTAASLLAGTPFDWRLTPPDSPQAMPWTDYATPSGTPQAYAEQLAVYALSCEDTLATAVIISLFTDARAGVDDTLPWGSTDRRGWVGDAYAEGLDRRDPWGSTLWLLYTSKRTVNLLERARFAAQEALAWMVRDGLASRVAVTAEWRGDVLAVRPVIWEASQSSPVYDVLWATSIRRNLGNPGAA